MSGWAHRTRASLTAFGAYQPVGHKARMNPGAGEGEQRPEVARETPQHSGDLVMASAELAMVDVEEEHRDTL